MTDNLNAATTHATALLAALDIEADPGAPRRLARALDELTAGRLVDPRRHLEVRFPPESPDPGLIALTGIPFASVCEHHLLPFNGLATVAYLPKPGERIVGLSKLARLVQEYGARPQVQERMADQVVAALMDVLSPRGAACALTATHACMALRGARTGTGAAMTTYQYAGELHDNPWRAEFVAQHLHRG